MKVVHYAKNVDFAGTSKVAQILVAELNKMHDIDAYLLYREDGDANNRLQQARFMLGEDRVIGHEWTPGESARRPPYIPGHQNLTEVLRELQPDIVHYHSSGYAEWPFKSEYSDAKWVMTNIFGYNGYPADHTVYISDFIAQRAGRQTPSSVLYNPTLMPFYQDRFMAHYKLAQSLGLPVESILIGRVGRADNFSPISLRAFQAIERQHPHCHYLVVNPCDGWRRTAADLGLKNVHFLDPIVTDMELSAFYSGLDIYAHARQDGECCPCNIQEAMIHGLPVVSHEGDTYQGQNEIIAQCGFVVPRDDWRGYAVHLNSLVVNDLLRREVGDRARRRAEAEFRADAVARKLATVYRGLMA